MQFVVVEKFIETICSGVIFLVLFVHDSDIVNELIQKTLHSFSCSREFHYLIHRARNLRLLDLTMDLEILLEAG